MSLPVLPVRLLYVAATSGRPRYEALLGSAPFAIEVQTAATPADGLRTGSAAPDVVVVELAGSGTLPEKLAEDVSRLFAVPPPLLVLGDLQGDEPAGLDVVVLPHPDQDPRLLYGIVRQLARSGRLARSSASPGHPRPGAQPYLADLSHDLRGPLNALLGYGELLEEELVGREEEGLAGEVRRMLALGQRILEVVVSFTDRHGLPDAAPERMAPAPEDAPSAPPAAPPSAATHLLLVDDDDDLRCLMAQYLESEGFRVSTAADGEEGLRLARDQHPAAITLDVEMPGMDGWEVLGRLKADPSLARTPVIMLTGRGNEHRAARALRQGADDYLMKGTITATAIRRAIAGVLEKARLKLPDTGASRPAADAAGAGTPPAASVSR